MNQEAIANNLRPGSPFDPATVREIDFDAVR